MKKRVLAVILALVMVFSLSIMTSYATESLTISEILATASNFPTVSDSSIPSDAWINGVGGKMFLKEGDNYLVIDYYGGTNLAITNTATKSGNSYVYTNGGIQYEFVMSNNVLSKVIVSGIVAEEGYNGTFKAPATVANVIATANNFPTNEQDAWGNEAGAIVYLNNIDGNDCLSFKKEGETFFFNVLLTTKLDDEKLDVNLYGTTFKFILSEDELVQIKVSDSGNALEGTYSHIYNMVDGKDTKISLGDNKDVMFRSDADFSKFVKVLVDGVEIANATNTDNDKCKVEEGSTITTLKIAYLRTLKEGTHTISIVSTDGQAYTTFTVLESSPETGIRTVSIFVPIMSLIVLIGCLVLRRKEIVR